MKEARDNTIFYSTLQKIEGGHLYYNLMKRDPRSHSSQVSHMLKIHICN